MEMKVHIKENQKLRRPLLRHTRELARNFFDEVPLGVEGLEFVQHAVGSVGGGKLDLILLAQALVEIGDPLLSPQFDEIVKSGALLIIGHGGANSGTGTVKVKPRSY